MRRIHRRAHLVLWLAIAPIALIGVVWGLKNPPADTAAPLPAALDAAELR